MSWLIPRHAYQTLDIEKWVQKYNDRNITIEI